MPCYKPLQAYRAKSEDGRTRITFQRRDGISEIKLPCGQCIGCRLERSRQWATRCMHEASTNKDNCFITLTYDDEHLPVDGGLCKPHYVKFMKRLRKAFTGRTIRFYMCGEYGSKRARPHYHALLFGLAFGDQTPWSVNGEGSTLYRSQTLEKLWGKGFCTIGEATFESAAYTARYIMKKITGDNASDHYTVIHPITGLTHEVEPEYNNMSRRPGIAKDWFDRHQADIYPHDEIIVRGHSCKPPAYYDKLFEANHVEDMKLIKQRRLSKAAKNRYNNTPDRLAVRETCRKASIKHLGRPLHDSQNV